MKSRTILLAILLSFPLFISCSHEKALTGNKSLNVQDVQTTKTNSVSQKSGSATFTQNSVMYAKTKKIVKLEAKLAKEKARIIAMNPLGIQIAKKPVVTVALVKDTVSTKPKELIIKADTTIAIVPVLKPAEKPAVKPAHKVTQIESYMRNPLDLMKFSVVVGSFSNLEEAFTMVKTMVKAGFDPVVVPNEKGMFRVIASSRNTRDSADIDALGLELDSIKCWIWAQDRK